MENRSKSRFGMFFILIGLVLLIIFLGSLAGNSGNKILYLLFSAAALFLGFLLSRRSKSEAASARFSSIRKFRDQSRKRREERIQKKQEKKKK
jgi:hypothetical protein